MIWRVLGLMVGLAGTAQARVHLTVDEALSLVFPGCEIREQTAYLSADQRERAAELGSVEVESSLVRQHIGVCDGRVLGTAYFDTHRVRTLPETLMIVVDPDGQVSRIEVLSFREPGEYMPPAPFFTQFQGKGLDDDLSYRRSSLRKVTGATLSCRAVLDATKRSLALHHVLTENE